MDELIVRCLTGEANDIEVRRVSQWRAASDANERAWQDARAVWRLVADAPEATDAAPPAPPALATLLSEAEARRRRGGARRRTRAVLRSPWAGYALASTAVLALVLGGLDRWRSGEGATLSPVGTSTMAGEIVSMSLSDGTVVRLAPGTRLRFPPQADRREVVLEGKAFFAVASDEAPFVVRTDAGSVTVRGTRFEVVSDGRDLRVVVVEGRVLLESDDGATELGPGQVGYLSAGLGPRRVDRADVWSLLDWPSGLLLFQATPLEDVAREVGRRFGTQVEVAPELAARRVTAWFEGEELVEVVSAVCLVADARCEIGDSLVTIRAR